MKFTESVRKHAADLSSVEKEREEFVEELLWHHRYD